MKTSYDFDAHWALVNDLLGKVNAEQAFRMGLASALCMMGRIQPTRKFFDGAIGASTLAEVAEWFRRFYAEHGAPDATKRASV